MIANWIHIVLVHLTVIGTPWLTYRVLVHRKAPVDGKLWKETFTGLIVLAVITAVVYFTGPEAADWTKEILESYSQEHVEDHALWGRVVFVIQGIAGLMGVMGWASILQEEKPYVQLPNILAFLLIINVLVIFYTAHLGGLIRRLDLVL